LHHYSIKSSGASVPELFNFKHLTFVPIAIGIKKIKKIIMGRGDKKTAKGKRFQGSFGKSRPAKKATPAKKAAAKKKD
jgi:30S ribosomal protein S31